MVCFDKHEWSLSINAVRCSTGVEMSSGFGNGYWLVWCDVKTTATGPECAKQMEQAYLPMYCSLCTLARQVEFCSSCDSCCKILWIIAVRMRQLCFRRVGIEDKHDFNNANQRDRDC